MNKLDILVKDESLTKDEGRKRKDQSEKRPIVHEKIQRYFTNMIDGDIANFKVKDQQIGLQHAMSALLQEPYMSRDLIKRTGK